MSETLNTLQFGKMAKTIKTRVSVNESVVLGYEELKEKYDEALSRIEELEENSLAAGAQASIK